MCTIFGPGHELRARARAAGVAVLVGAVLLAVPGVRGALAQPASGKAATSAKQRAKELYRKAEVQYNLGQFKRALALYSAAYQALQLPGFLFNIGQCHRNLRNYRKALFFYQGYLRKERRPANRALVLRVMKLTEQKIAEEAAARRVRQVTRPRLSDPNPRPRPLVVVPKPRSRRGIHQQWWFWTALVAGVATVVGLSVGLTSMKRSDDSGVPSGSLGTIDVRF